MRTLAMTPLAVLVCATMASASVVSRESESLGDLLGRTADVFHQEIVKRFNERKIDQAQAQSLFESETGLRLAANALYCADVGFIAAEVGAAQSAGCGHPLTAVSAARKAMGEIRSTPDLTVKQEKEFDAVYDSLVDLEDKLVLQDIQQSVP